MNGLVERIQRLKKECNAVILAHNYQLPEVQDVADFTGDSLGLSVQASETKADVIVFCGVYFMAETAKILSPDKTVLIPDLQAGCPMADMITAQDLRKLKQEHPRAKVVCYVNSSAEVKAESDICCTSANAVSILKEMFTDKDEIIFVPDKYLGGYAASQTGRKVILWPGYCPTHAKILPEQIVELKQQHPLAKVLVHPECAAPVVHLADAVLSTSGMLQYAKSSDAREFIMATENGMLYPLQKANPGKQFYVISELTVCPNMKKITLEKVVLALEKNQFAIELPADIIERARRPILQMINQSVA